MEDIKNMVQQTIAEIDAVVEMFYQQKTLEAYAQLDPALGKFMSTIEAVVAYQQEHAEAAVDINGMTEALKEALSALEEKDAILMADVLKYEIIEQLEAIASVL